MNPNAPQPTPAQRARAAAAYEVRYLGAPAWNPREDYGYGVVDSTGAVMARRLPTAEAAEERRRAMVESYARLIAWDDAHRLDEEPDR